MALGLNPASHGHGDPLRFIRERIRMVKHVSGHWGRHNGASLLYDRGADDHEVMGHLGWQDIRSAKRYRQRSRRQQHRMADMLDFGAEAEPALPPVKERASARDSANARRGVLRRLTVTQQALNEATVAYR